MSVFGHFRHGKGSRVTANGVNMGMAQWTTDWKADRGDTTNFESGGNFQGLTGVNIIEISADGKWNAQTNAYDSPPGIFPQDFFPNLLLYENLADVVGWNFPLHLIDSAKSGASVRDVVTFSWSGCSQGTYSAPTGSV